MENEVREPKNDYKMGAATLGGLAVWALAIAGLTSDYVGFLLVEVLIGIALLIITIFTLTDNAQNRALNRRVYDRLVSIRNEIQKAHGKPARCESPSGVEKAIWDIDRASGLLKTVAGVGFAALLFIGLTRDYLGLTSKEAAVWCYIVFGFVWAGLYDRALGDELNSLSSELRSAEEELKELQARQAKSAQQ